MANANTSNYSLQAANNAWSAVWKLTRTMKKAGWTTVYSSDGTSKSAVTDYWGSNVDPANDTYPAFDSVSCWIVMRGPSTVKLGITAAPTGTPLRGEIVTQTSSGATGELLGYVFDSVGGTGWIVIAPRTGTFDGTNNVTGGTSSAVFTVSSYKLYVREIMICKAASSIFNGTMYYICADSVGESTSLFSYLAANAAGCTATVGPAMGGTGVVPNTFPTIAICCKGAAGSVSPVTLLQTTTSFNNKAQLIAVNCTADASNSADGSFWCSVAHTNVTDGQIVFGFTRVDDSEPGDIDPYVWVYPSAVWQSSYAYNSTMNGSSSAQFNYTDFVSTISTIVFGYMSRGNSVTARDKAVYFQPFNLLNADFITHPTSGANYTMYNTPATTMPNIRFHPNLVYYKASTFEVFNKGKTRWLAFISTGNRIDTADSKRWLAIENRVTSTSPSVIIGPYDGTTTPSSS